MRKSGHLQQSLQELIHQNIYLMAYFRRTRTRRISAASFCKQERNLQESAKAEGTGEGVWAKEGGGAQS